MPDRPTARPPAPAAARGGVEAPAALSIAAVVALLAAMMAIFTAGPAAAHDVLIGTDPRDGATLATAPAQIRLTFAERVSRLGTLMRVTAPGGAVLPTGPVEVVDATVSQPLPTGLTAGIYTVLWRATSADGHPVSGRLSFTVTGPAATSPSASATSPSASGATVAASATATAVATTTPGRPSIAIGAVVLLVLTGAGMVVKRRRGTEP